jgi:hypothetical protein
MQTKTIGFISAVMAGALLVTGVAISASPDTTHLPANSKHGISPADGIVG